MYNIRMRRALTVFVLAFVMAFQAMTVTVFSSSQNNLADITHSMLHWQQESHHHNDSGSYQVDDSDASTLHLLADHNIAPVILPVADLWVFRLGTGIPPVFLALTTSPPFLEGLLRPPRPTV